LLFCIFLEVVTARALDTKDIGTKISGSCLNNLKFAKDIALAAQSEVYLQDLIHRVDAESKKFGLQISTAKTEVQCIATQEQILSIDINGERIQESKDFVYLGGKISDISDSSSDVNRRIGLASGVARSLTTIWKSRNISTKTKVRLYDSLVLAVLLYNSKTWTLKEVQNRKLCIFEMNIMRRIMGVSRRDRRGNVDKRAELGGYRRHARSSTPEIVHFVQDIDNFENTKILKSHGILASSRVTFMHICYFS